MDIQSKDTLAQNWMVKIIGIVFIGVAVWWLLIHPFDSTESIDQKHFWSSSYELISILGGVFGLIVSKHFGGKKSMLGRAILAFSIGLFLQSFGQTVYNYYTLIAKTEIPYPSLGDVGYFGSIIAYIYGALMLGKLSGLKHSLTSTLNKVVVIVLPLVMLVISYALFLRNYQFIGTQPLTVFLDFGYPLGQVIYVSIALYVLYVSQKFLGGIMKNPILLVLTALVVQYICDFNFLFQAHQDSWYAGSIGDFLYAVSYLLMTVAIISIGDAVGKIKSS